MLTKFRIWRISRKKYMTASDLAFLVRAAEEGYDVPRIAGVKKYVELMNSNLATPDQTGRSS